MTLRERLLQLVDGTGGDVRPSLGDARVRESAFEASPLAQLVVDRAGMLSLVNLQARMLFGVSQRNVGRPFQDLEIAYRPVDLRAPVDAALRDRQAVSLQDVQWRGGRGDPSFYDIQFVPLGTDSGGPVGVSVTFADVTRYRQVHSSVEHARRELETAYGELQSTADELATTNTELRSTNAELETTNEQLQSTNEELETMNAELETLSDELRRRTDDLDHVNVFVEAILESLESAVAVLDRELRVQAWSARAADLWGLRPAAVRGAHFLGLDIGLPVGELAEPLRRCLRDDGSTDVTFRALDRRGRPVACDVKIRPLRTSSGENDGLIVLMDARAEPSGDEG